MAKRFTDTDKWRQDWYLAMSVKHRDLRSFLFDDCDHAGIWKIAIGRASLILGYEVSIEDVKRSLCDKCIISGDLLLIEDFVPFQYEELSATSRVHRSVLILLDKFKKGTGTDTLSIGYRYPIDRVKDKDKDSYSSSSFLNLKNARIEPKRLFFDFESLYRIYPLRKGKSRGLRLCASQIKTIEDFNNLRSSIENYRSLLEKERTETRFIKHFGTFLGCWRDYLDSDVGDCLVNKPEDKYAFLYEVKNDAQ